VLFRSAATPNPLSREAIFRQAMNTQLGLSAAIPLAGTETERAGLNLQAINQQLHDTAAAYRMAPPEQRAQLRQQYADIMQAKVAAAQEQAGINQPKSEEEKIAHYRESLMRHQGIDPYMIGSARLKPEGGMEVLSPQEEYGLRDQTNEGVRRMVKMENAARVLERKKDPESIMAAQELRAKRIREGIKWGFINPYDPRAGLNMDQAFQVAAANRLAGRLNPYAEEQQSQATLPAAQTRTPAQLSQQALEALSMENFKRQQQEFEEELRRRQARIMGIYGTAG